jgi:hypothetical protein
MTSINHAQVMCVHVKYLANLLALVYNFYSLDYNFCEHAEDYGWKDQYVIEF